jgi:hypothetical protein
MRLVVIIIIAIALTAALPQARASVGFSCDAKDKAAVLAISGAYGTSIGSGMANFGADIAILQPAAPIEVRKLVLDRSHVSQHWFNGDDLKLMARWEPPDTKAPYREVILIVEAHRRAKAEESPYHGRYTLLITAAGADPALQAARLEVRGAIVCGIG